MRKSPEVLKAELTLATMIRNNTVGKALAIVETMANFWKYIIAQKVTVAIIFALLWDLYEDFDKDMMIELYKQYIDYHTRFNRGDEKIYQQMMAVDELLDGELMKEDMFDAIKKKAEEEICGTTL